MNHNLKCELCYSLLSKKDFTIQKYHIGCVEDWAFRLIESKLKLLLPVNRFHTFNESGYEFLNPKTQK